MMDRVFLSLSIEIAFLSKSSLGRVSAKKKFHIMDNIDIY